jgi:subtilisin family serine protease
LLVGQGIISLNAEFKPDGHVTLQRIIERYPDLAIEVKDEITSQGPFLVEFGNIDTPAATIQALEVLRTNPTVRDAEPVVIGQMQQAGTKLEKLEPNDPHYKLQSANLELIGMPTAWAITTGSTNVCVAVIDSGIFAPHPDLNVNLLAGYDFLDNDTDPSAAPGTANNHGTHVAGTIAARGNNRMGVAGVTWGSRVVPVRAAPGGSNFIVAKAIRWSAGLPVTGVPNNANPCRVINMSIGFMNPPTCNNFGLSGAIIQGAVDEAEAAGVVVVASAGNEAQSCPAPQNNIPATLNNVISVAAVTPAGVRAIYSNEAPTNFIAAPGGSKTIQNDQVASTIFIDDGATRTFSYAYSAGTSMASPHVAGVVALMLSVNPGLTPAQVRDILARTADDKGATGRDNIFGHGIVRADKAVAEASGTPSSLTPRVTAIPSSLQLNGNQTTGKITVSNRGNPNVAVTFQSGIEQEVTGGNWLTVTFPTAGSSAPFDITLTANRTGLAPGRYRGRVEVTSSASRIVVPVTLVVPGTPDIGTITVQLVNPTTGVVVASTTTNAAASYRYSMSGFAAGSYLIKAESAATGVTRYSGAYPIRNEAKPYAINGPETVVGFTVDRISNGTAGTKGASGVAITDKVLAAVYDTVYGEPLANVTISIAGGASTQTDVDGEAVVSGVSGAVTITASAPGYSTQTFVGINSEYIEFELEPTGTLASPVKLTVTAEGLVNGETAYVSAIVDGEIESIAEVTMGSPTAILVVNRDRELSIGILANNANNVATKFNIEELEPIYVDSSVSIVALAVPSSANTDFGYVLLGPFGMGSTHNTVALAYDYSGAQYVIGARFDVPIGQMTSLSRASLGSELDDIVVGQIINFSVDGDGNSSAQSFYSVLSGFDPSYPIQFHAAPTLSAPVDNSPGEPVTPNFQFSIPTGSLFPSALKVLSIEDSNGFLWKIFLPPATTSFQLPALSSGGLAANTTYTWAVEDFVIDGFSYNEFSMDFDSFFDKATVSFSRTFTTAP